MSMSPRRALAYSLFLEVASKVGIFVFLWYII